MLTPHRCHQQYQLHSQCPQLLLNNRQLCLNNYHQGILQLHINSPLPLPFPLVILLALLADHHQWFSLHHRLLTSKLPRQKLLLRLQWLTSLTMCSLFIKLVLRYREINPSDLEQLIQLTLIRNSRRMYHLHHSLSLHLGKARQRRRNLQSL